MSRSALVYRGEGIAPPVVVTPGLSVETWRPSLRSPSPPGKPLRYATYGLFDRLGVFRPGLYRQLTAVVDGERAAAALLLPGHFRYPFMARDDLQIIYVQTVPEWRGRGIALQMLFEGLKSHAGKLWYVTSEDNRPSQRLAEKAGFSLMGRARRGRTPVRRLVML